METDPFSKPTLMSRLSLRERKCLQPQHVIARSASDEAIQDGTSELDCFPQPVIPDCRVSGKSGIYNHDTCSICSGCGYGFRLSLRSAGMTPRNDASDLR